MVLSAPVSAATCDLTLRRRFDEGRLILENIAGSDRRPAAGAEHVTLWSRLPPVGGAVVTYSHAASPGAVISGRLADPLTLLGQGRGGLQQLRMLEAEVETPCCQSRLAVELRADGAVFRGAVHRPMPGAAPEVAELRSTYPVRAAGDWAVCDWNAHALDPLVAAGMLVVDDATDAAGERAPSLYVLWRDVDGVPRGWEAFGHLRDAPALQRALNADFRYARRDRELLVIDRSPPPPPGQRSPTVSENVTTTEFATLPIEKIQAEGQRPG